MRLKTVLYALGLGAGAMYFYDPTRGETRRARLRDQAMRLRSDVEELVDTGMQDLRNRTRGTLAEMTARLSDQPAPDWILEERVRSRLGFSPSQTGSLQVRAEDGRVVLSGHALTGDIDNIIQAAARTRGVRGVESQVQVVDNPADIPSLRGGRMSQPRQAAWSPATRLLAGAGGALLTLYSMTRGGLLKPVMGATGLFLAARSLTNMDTKSMLGMGLGGNAIQVNKAINIHAPIDQVYAFWANFENFPLFMNHIKSITTQDGMSHWTVAGPAGSSVEFDARTTRDVPNQIISWETEPESQVHHTGFVRFDENRDGSTRVTVQMRYVPPAGAVGHAVAKMFGVDPRQSMNDDLARLKTLLEEGKTSTDDTRVVMETGGQTQTRRKKSGESQG